MSVNKEVRDFFTRKIFAVLDAQIAKLEKPIDNKKVEKEAISHFEARHGLKNILALHQKLEQQERDLNKAKEEFNSTLRGALRKEDSNFYSYDSGLYSNFLDHVNKYYRQEVSEDLYPGIAEKVARIEEMKSHVQEVVLLSTTEPKLVARLTKLLQNYGGEIAELLALIPD
jgi:phage shock protein A